MAPAKEVQPENLVNLLATYTLVAVAVALMLVVVPAAEPKALAAQLQKIQAAEEEDPPVVAQMAVLVALELL